MKAGEYLLSTEEIEINAGKSTVTLTVRHTGDRPIQVGSHYHFFEVNSALDFDRAKAYGMRLDIPSGMAVRIEPGDEKQLQLTSFGGGREVFGHRGLVNGSLSQKLNAAGELK